MSRKVVFACDHAATHCHKEILAFITAAGPNIEAVYVGPTTADAVDYPDYALKVTDAVTKGEAELGVLVCGTGIGMSMAANKVPGIRAALCHDHLTASLTRQHNNANVLCIGERVVGMEVIRDMIATFVNTPFSDAERHQNRIDKITAIEKLHE